jgi:hypothetical protein
MQLFSTWYIVLKKWHEYLIHSYFPVDFFDFWFTDVSGAASNSAYYGYPELWI